MTFISPDQRTSSAPNGSRLGMPSHLEALIYKPDLKPFNWRKQVKDVQRITRQVEREQEMQLQRQKIEEERKRRQKMAKFEIDRKRNLDAYKAQLKIDKETGLAKFQNKYLSHQMRFERLISIFCKAFGVSHESLIGDSRKRDVVKNRQLIMWLLNQDENLQGPAKSLSAIGRRFGNRDHSTVLHSVRKINETKPLLRLAEEMQATVLFLEREAYGDE